MFAHAENARSLSAASGDIQCSSSARDPVKVAVTPAGRSAKTVPARKLHVLVDADLTSWQAWNDFATWRKLAAKIAALNPGRVPPASPPAVAE